MKSPLSAISCRRSPSIFNRNRRPFGVGFTRPEWNEAQNKQSGTVERKVTEDFFPGGPGERSIIFEAPFDRCDREKDYTTAWKEFERRRK